MLRFSQVDKSPCAKRSASSIGAAWLIFALVYLATTPGAAAQEAEGSVANEFTSPAVGAASVQSAASLDETCDVIAKVAQTDPKEALDLLLTLREDAASWRVPSGSTQPPNDLLAAGPCADAFALVIAGSGVAKICATATALADGGEPERAKATIEDLRSVARSGSPARAACAAELTAIDKQIAGADAVTLESATDGWAEFIKQKVAPFEQIGAFLLGSWLIGLLLARLLIFIPALRDSISTRRQRVLDWVFGLLLILAAPLLSVSLVAVNAARAVTRLSDGEDEPADDGLGWFNQLFVAQYPALEVLSILLVLGGSGAMLLARGLAAIRRIGIEVTGVDSADGAGAAATPLTAAAVAAVLRELGGRGPRGLEIPVGPDVDALDNALSPLSDNPWAAAAQKFALVITSLRPWRLELTVPAMSDATVSIRRNGREVTSHFVNTAIAAVDGVKVASLSDERVLAVFAASYMMAELRRKYPSEFNSKMYGASEGASIALQYLASSDYLKAGKAEAGARVAARALDLDPGNELAEATWWFLRYREATKGADMESYRSWLKRAIYVRAHKAGADGVLQSECADTGSKEKLDALATDDLLMRLLATHGSLSRNLQSKDVAALPEDKAFAKNLIALARRRTEMPDAAVGEEVYHVSSKIDFDELNLAVPNDDHVKEYIERASSPYLAYSLACHLVRRGATLTTTPPNDRDAQVILLLRRAFDADGFQTWAPRDPELSTISSTQAFRALLRPPGELEPAYAWPPFLKWRDVLEANPSLWTVTQLRDATWDVTYVSGGLTSEDFIKLTRVAALWIAANEVDGLGGFEPVAVSRLSMLNVISVTDIDTELATPGHPKLVDVAGRLREAGREIDAMALVGWLEQLRNALQARTPGT